jgi:7-carboxy-7-deazaguanine synthase
VKGILLHMKKYKINEIFYSLQGEGFWVGTPCIFIRFSGCNLNCSFCDTKHKEYKKYNIIDIFNEIQKYKCKNIVLTGGEPFLQIDELLLTYFKDLDYYIMVESNGTIIKSNIVYSSINWLTISPKKKYKEKNIVKANELKVIYSEQNQELTKLYDQTSLNCKLYLQPCDGLDNVKETIDFIKENTKWRLSLQTHKLIGIK